MDEAKPYQVWVFDCPSCGGQTQLSADSPDRVEECADCGEQIRMAD